MNDPAMVWIPYTGELANKLGWAAIAVADGVWRKSAAMALRILAAMVWRVAFWTLFIPMGIKPKMASSAKPATPRASATSISENAADAAQRLLSAPKR